MFEKILIILLAACTAAAFAGPAPLSGDFDIIHVPDDIIGVSFDPLPWSDTTTIWSAYLNPYATPDYNEGYSGTHLKYNLGEVRFVDGSYIYEDYRTYYTNENYEPEMVHGDFAIRAYNLTGKTITFQETITTININGTPLDIYLPEFSFSHGQSIHFWIADNGSSYYANSSYGPGSPNQTAAESIANGDIARQAIPEPASITLLLSGAAIALRRKANR